TPTRHSRASVVGPTTRPSRRSRSAPSSPPRSTYPIFALRTQPGPRYPAWLRPRSAAPLKQVEVGRLDQVLLPDLQGPAQPGRDLLALGDLLPRLQDDLHLQESAESRDLVQVDARLPDQEEPAPLAHLAPHAQRLSEDGPQGRGLRGPGDGV